MIQERIEKNIQISKQSLLKIFELLWQFKWYVGFDLLFIIFLLVDYFNPPAVNDPIWGSEATYGAWNYQNQQLYIQSCKYDLIISGLIFIVGTSNMRNHPFLSKLIFLFPIFIGWIGLL